MFNFYVISPKFILLMSLISCFFIFFPVQVSAQLSRDYVIRLVSNSGQPVAGAAASVRVSGLQQTITSNQEGKIQMIAMPEGNYQVLIHATGYQDHLLQVRAGQKEATITVVLRPSAVQLKEAGIQLKTATKKVIDHPVKAEVIQTKAAQSQPSSLIELMNRSAGIRIRQTGGLGSDASLSVNGFQGKSVKYFKDGIPMDYLGAGYGLSTVPVNMLERVEVYKGVLPVNLGADALGGAVNMVSRYDGNRYMAVSYEAGSFNTHRVSVNTQLYNAKTGIFGGVDGFFNHSDNSYKVTAQITDTAKSIQHPEKVKLFHNSYTQYYAEAFAGIKNTSWADELKLSITGFYINRENQFGARMEKPFGASYGTQRTVTPSLRYKKQWLDNRLSFDQFVVYSNIRSAQTDTLQGRYDWYGNFTPLSDARLRGESGNPTLSRINFTNFTSRSNLGYQLNADHHLGLNIVYADLGRNGSDRYGPTTSGDHPEDLLSLPSNYKKLIATAGINSSFLDHQLENVFQVKYFNSHANGLDANIINPSTEATNNTISRFGLAESVRFAITKNSYFRFSAELATRLPEQQEVFGDGVFTLSNFKLKPERSSNFNLGFKHEKQGIYSIEVNTFYRITKDMILTVPKTITYAQYQNVEQVKGIGLETDLNVYVLPGMVLNGNFTYQDFRLYRLQDPLLSYLENARLRNTPYFFANLGLRNTFKNLINKKDQLQTYYYFSFVREYYLDYIPKDTEPSGFLGLWGKSKINTPNIIPSQYLHSAGLVYAPAGIRAFTIGLEAKNIFNADIYDSFKVQNAGRSIHLKLNYIIK